MSSSSTAASSSTTSSASSGACGYATSFPLPENPIAEGGMWTTGKAVGVDWNDPETTPGAAFASTIATGYNDDVAHLTTSFTPDQYAEATVFVAPGYAPPAKHEVELLLRFHITPNVARGYEILWGITGYLAIVRWEGPLSSYTALLDTGDPGIGPPADGDVFRAEIHGSTITVFKNGAMVGTANDATWTDGQPGIGFWPTPGATTSSYGFKSYCAGGF